MTRSTLWVDEAACAEAPDRFFFPPELDELSKSWQEFLYSIGKTYCEHCPVRDDCLLYALENRETWGLWGGLTPKEREEFYD